jgi:hypothetical protein
LLAQAGRWAESLAELEALLPERPNDASLHRLLADDCQRLGLLEKADQHRRRAESMPE